MSTYLMKKWQELIGPYSVEPVLAHHLYEEIVAAHSEDHRAYHVVGHIEQLLRSLEAVSCFSESCQWACWYHDFKYQPGCDENELMSAVVSNERMLMIGVPYNVRRKVIDIILATKDHPNTDDYEMALFLDADMSILGSDDVVYASYLKGLQFEYRDKSPEWRQSARKAFVENCLKRGHIFSTARFCEVFEARATSNLLRELGVTTEAIKK